MGHMNPGTQAARRLPGVPQVSEHREIPNEKIGAELCRKEATMSNASCTIKTLPQSQWAAAAAKAIEINPLNAPVNVAKAAALGAVLKPEHLAIMTKKYWGSKVRLTVGFLDSPPSDLKARILGHMNAWGNWSNTKFVESTVSPQVRIARTAGDGFWSYLGTEILSIGASDPTMNLASFTMQTPDSEFYRVVRHETGHTIVNINPGDTILVTFEVTINGGLPPGSTSVSNRALLAFDQ